LRWVEEKKSFFGGLVVKRRDLKVATMCRYNGLITTHTGKKERKKKEERKRTCSHKHWNNNNNIEKKKREIKIKNNTYSPPKIYS
jgi:hypothetical protein